MATVEQFRYWQEKGTWHQLTCGPCSNAGRSHVLLEPKAEDVEGGVVLVCPDGHAQIPAPYLHRMAETMQEYTETMTLGKIHDMRRFGTSPGAGKTE